MISLLLFCEDSFHEAFVLPFVRRVAQEAGIDVRCKIRTARGGLPKMAGELESFLQDVEIMKETRPDALIIVADGNCKSVAGRRKEFSNQKIISQLGDQVVYAIPNPHIERWMMVDPQAFKKVFGTGCQALPATKCVKGEYKRILREEFSKADFVPALGGREYAAEIVEAMDLDRASREDDAFSDCVKSFRSLMNRLKIMPTA
ncbi:MAG: hypothetical protein ABSA48_03865 [Terracidiphilus sp.]